MAVGDGRVVGNTELTTSQEHSVPSRTLSTHIVLHTVEAVGYVAHETSLSQIRHAVPAHVDEWWLAVDASDVEA